MTRCSRGEATRDTKCVEPGALAMKHEAAQEKRPVTTRRGVLERWRHGHGQVSQGLWSAVAVVQVVGMLNGRLNATKGRRHRMHDRIPGLVTGPGHDAPWLHVTR